MATAKRDINKYSLYLVYLAIGEFFTIFMATTGFSLIGEHIALRTRQEYLKAVLRQEIAFFEGTSSGEVATKLSTDINQIQDGISEKVALILSGLAAFVASLIISFIKSWKLTFIVLSSTIALILTFVVGAKLLIGFKSKSIETQSQLSGISEEAVASVRLTTAFGAQEFILNHYNNFLKQGQIVGFKVRCANGILIGCGTAIIYMEHALSFWQGSRFLVNNEISLSAVITIQIAIMMGGASLAQLLPQLQAIPTAIAAGKKVFGTIERRSLIDSLRNEGNTMEMTNGHIEFNCVRFKYPSRKNDVFESLTFTAPAKKITALVGPSGCGKSTVISLLERFYEPISGYIKLDNFNISDLNVRWLRQQISLVNQEPTLFSGTIFENIEFGLKETVTQQVRVFNSDIKSL
jgi:ATP-binding cassette subfamily B (MDR/TAP) protein 1